MNVKKPVRRVIAMAALVGSIAGVAGATGAAHADSMPATQTPAAAPVPMAVAPAKPQSLVAYPGNQSVSLTWKAPLTNGGAAVTSYTVQWAPSANGPWNFFGTSYKLSYVASSAYFNNGTPYFFRIRANNSAGSSAYTAPVSAVPRGVPGKIPTCQAFQSSPGSKWVVIKWTPPYTNGGAPITHFEVTLYKDGLWYNAHTVPNQNLTSYVDSLPVGSYGDYQYRVKALNVAGYGGQCGTTIRVTAW